MVKIIKILAIVLIIVFLANLFFEKKYTKENIQFGVTFSPKYAKYLKLDWQKTYTSMLEDLKVKNLRLLTYWDVLQKDFDKYDFTEIDYLLEQAKKKGTRVILVLGERQPRWPECHIPSWAQKLNSQERLQKLLQFIQTVVERYNTHPAVIAWQVENEPLLKFFGEGCDNFDKSFLKQEVSLVKKISNKPIVMSDSGELGFWATPMQNSDIFGTTLYRRVYDKSVGYITYPVQPYFYSLKSDLIRSIFASNNQKTIIVELQAEPWFKDGKFVSSEEQAQLFTAQQFKDYTDFAKKTGFTEAYLWGVEWWYFMDQQGYPQYLNFAKTLFK